MDFLYHKGSGYQYGRVKLVSHPLHTLPIIDKLAESLAHRFKLASNELINGCFLEIYWHGKDSINWHANDTQGEDLVLPLMVDAPADA
jgi:hypothetical protein